MPVRLDMGDETRASAEDTLRLRVEKRLGTTLRGKYVLERVLGIGGMAAVYEAMNTRVERRCAVKMLHPELSIIPEIQSRFLREGRASNAVKHPGVVDVIDTDVAEDGSAFMVMELLQGEVVEDLQARAGGRLDVATTLRIGHELCSVLAAAHEGGIVHRDIKPANLFVTSDGRLKVLDFGIARVRDAQSSTMATQAGSALGTPAYMAPEQALGAVAEIGPRTDVWATGATLFTLLSGELVHNESRSAQELVIKSATTPARSLASVALPIPQDVVRVVDRALAFEARDRFGDALEMQRALADAFRRALGERESVAAPIRYDASANASQGALSPAAQTAPLPAARTPNPTQLANSVTKQIEASDPAFASGAPTKKGSLAAWIAVGAVGVGVAVFLVVGRTVLGTTVTPGTALVATSSVAARAPSAEPPTAVPAPSAIASGMPVEPTPEPSASPSQARGASAPRVPAAKAKPAPSAASSGPPKPNCNPNYTLDADGNKRFKPECF